MLRTSLTCAIVLVAAVGCPATSFPPPPPDPHDAVFDELESGSCNETLTWYMNDYDPWADAYCRAQGGSREECGTDAPE